MSREKNMKKIILLITVLSLSTFVSAGFFSDDKDKVKNEDNVVEQKYSKTEFHGLKAGMTKAEVKEYLELDKYLDIYNADYSYSESTLDDLYTDSLKSYYFDKLGHKDISNKRFFAINLFFTDENILWKIQITFNMPSDTLSEIALRNVIGNNFPDANIEEKSGSEYIGSTSFPYHHFYVIMADEEIAKSAINKLESKFEKEM